MFAMTQQRKTQNSEAWLAGCLHTLRANMSAHMNSMTKFQIEYQAAVLAGHTQGGRPNTAGDRIAEQEVQKHAGCQVNRW